MRFNYKKYISKLFQIKNQSPFEKKESIREKSGAINKKSTDKVRLRGNLANSANRSAPSNDSNRLYR